MSERKNFDFPVLEKVIIKNFSLYKKKDVIEIDFNKDVFCLAGANGLGKSTFLTIINYALTGVVLDPKRNFKSVVSTSTFYNQNKKFAEDYFSGRVAEDDRDTASVYLKFKLGNKVLELERGFFNLDELFQFKEGDNQFDDLSESGKHSKYVETVLEQTTLKSFDQFFFIQHFILTFDEYHHLLFWDKALMETALYLFIGLNPEEAQSANQLRKKINQYGSNIRNWSDQRNRTVKEVKSLRNQLGDLNDMLPDEIMKDYETLQDEISQLKEKIYNNEREEKQNDLNLSDYSLRRTELEREYEKEFSNFINPNYSNLCDDDYMKSALDDLKTAVCSEDDYSTIIRSIVEHISLNHCSKNINNHINDKLKSLDEDLKKIKDEISSKSKTKERLIEHRHELKKSLNEKERKSFDIEEQYGDAIKHLKAASQSDLTGVLSSYDTQIEKLNKDIDQRKKDRVKLKKKLQALEKNLHLRFKKAESDFIPQFKTYVENFLGLEVRINLRNKSDGTVLILEINDTERTDTYQLSESQRYFVDIGLRMALIDYACDSSMFLIDTPEGSLDIAYESKAGHMFSNFAKNNKLIMTANINSSELLQVLADECKKQRMTLERMTEWTLLSEVQQQEETKIDRAYKSIEKKLN